MHIAPIIDISSEESEEDLVEDSEDERTAELLRGVDPQTIPLVQDAPPLLNKRTRLQRTPSPSLQPPKKRGRPRKDEGVKGKGAR
jgi:hypothetical protein